MGISGSSKIPQSNKLRECPECFRGKLCHRSPTKIFRWLIKKYLSSIQILQLWNY